MNIQLSSDDKELQRMCSEILVDLPGGNLHLIDGSSSGKSSAADFYIWDFKQKLAVPKFEGSSLSSHLFLVQRKDLDSLFECLGRTDALVLLKPTAKATLASFIRMAVSVQKNRMSEVSAMHSDHEEVVRSLVESNLKLQEADHDRIDFLARGLHDFRTPLTAIFGYCGLLLNEALGPLNEKQKEVLRRMDHSTKRLFRMASTMFQLNGPGKGLKFDLTDIRECVAQAAYEVGPLADGKRISLSIDLDQKTPLFHFESGLVEQVLVNLLENACKFTPRNGEIEVRGRAFFWDRRVARHPGLSPSERRMSASKEPNAYRIDIRDSGAPIPIEHLQNMFAEDMSKSAEPDRSGGGLGLVICRMVAAQHQGRILAQNTGEGPVFSLILPFRKDLEKEAGGVFRPCNETT
jgi:signal transduction histidine kinase